MCEGKTDIIYLKCALKQLSSTYKDLIDLSDGKASYKIGFLNFSKNFKDIFSISTGTSGLDFLMESYKKNVSEFKSPGKSHPVVIVLDNDDGLKEIKKKLKIKNGDAINDFYRFIDNLYVLIIPKTTEGAIEDLFDPNVLNTKIEGKSFNRNSEMDSNQEYGKVIFAEKVISADQKNINFDKFKEPFDRLRKIIKDCEDKIV